MGNYQIFFHKISNLLSKSCGTSSSTQLYTFKLKQVDKLVFDYTNASKLFVNQLRVPHSNKETVYYV